MPRKPKKPVKITPPAPFRLPTLAEGRILATAASKGYFQGWRSRNALYEKAAAVLGVRKVLAPRGLWQERRWSAPLRRTSALFDGAGALSNIWIEQ